MPVIANTIKFWESFGVFSIVLPFILVFAIIYGLLTKMDFFPKRSTNALIAGTAALIATAFGYYGNCLSAFVIASILSITIILIFYLGVGFFTKEPNKSSAFAWIITIVVFYLVFTTFPTCRFPSLGIPLALWLILAVVIGLIVWIYRDKSGKKGDIRKPEEIKKEKPKEPEKPQ